MAVAPKKSFDIKAEDKLKPEDRQAHALEFIAHYLDRIEGHLERLANAVASGASVDGVKMELSKIAAQASRIAPK